MLEGGADVRFIQEMLVRANLETTQFYTQVSVRKLQEVHAATHPSVKRGRFEQAAAVNGPEDRNAQSLLAVIAEDDEEEASETNETGRNA